MSGRDTVHEITPNNPQALAKKKKKKKIIHSLKSLKPHFYKSGQTYGVGHGARCLPVKPNDRSSCMFALVDSHNIMVNLQLSKQRIR